MNADGEPEPLLPGTGVYSDQDLVPILMIQSYQTNANAKRTDKRSINGHKTKSGGVLILESILPFFFEGRPGGFSCRPIEELLWMFKK